MLRYHVLLTNLGQTTNEHIRGVFHNRVNPYNEGFTGNCFAICCQSVPPQDIPDQSAELTMRDYVQFHFGVTLLEDGSVNPENGDVERLVRVRGNGSLAVSSQKSGVSPRNAAAAPPQGPTADDDTQAPVSERSSTEFETYSPIVLTGVQRPPLRPPVTNSRKTTTPTAMDATHQSGDSDLNVEAALPADGH